MKNNLSIILCFIVLGWCLNGNSAELTISIDNPAPDGMVAFALFDNANAFGDLRDPAKVVILPLDGREVFHIKDIPPGEYALLVYFDENGNKRIDKNFIGVPIEPLGFSNRYAPKGPPTFSRATFKLGAEDSRHFDVELYRPLGKFGRIGIGLGVIGRTSPYRDYDSGVYQLIPAISYIGERFQITGPKVQFGLVGSGKMRLAATGSYRMGVYEEDESEYLQGLGDRKDTFMAGLAFQAELPGGFDLSAGYEHDVLNQIGGGTAQVEISKSFQAGVFRFSPGLAVNWLSSELSNHDFGVEPENATSERSAYDVGDTISIEAGLGLFVEITREWMVIVNASVELLDDKATDSPIVSEDYVVKGFAAVSYVF